MSGTMTLADVRESMTDPENAGRAAVLVYEEGRELVTVIDGEEFRATNVFGLDSKIRGHAPTPRNLYLVSREDAERWNA